VCVEPKASIESEIVPIGGREEEREEEREDEDEVEVEGVEEGGLLIDKDGTDADVELPGADVTTSGVVYVRKSNLGLL